MWADGMSGLFISYRRDDAAGHAGRLFDHLSRTFGADEVFMDVDDIQRGDTFADTLTERLQQADVLLAVIGPRWLTLADAAGTRRLDKADDWVRTEVSGALAGGRLVIPVARGRRGPAARGRPAGRPARVDRAPDGRRARRLLERRRRSPVQGHQAPQGARILVEALRTHWMSAAVTLFLALAAGGYSAYTYVRSNRIAVPSASGLTLDRATRAITDAGLQVGAVSKTETNDYPPDWVLEQHPATQTSVRKGSAVSLTVAAPKAVDLTPYVTVRDVGREGTVAAAACATAMDASLAAQGRPVQVSMRYIYEKAKRHDEMTGEGTFLETTIYVVRQFGAPPETIWPYTSLNRKLPKGLTWGDLDRAAADYKARLTQIADLDGVLGALDKKTPVLVAAVMTSAWSTDLARASGRITPAAADGHRPGDHRYHDRGLRPRDAALQVRQQLGRGVGRQGIRVLRRQ